jgi:hypothetical protein
MGPMLEEVAAIKLILTHVLSKLLPDERREMSEKIHNKLQEVGEGGLSMATYRTKIDEIFSNAASLSQ